MPQPSPAELTLCILMPLAVAVSGSAVPSLSRGAEVVLFGCLAWCAQRATPTPLELALLSLAALAAAIGAARRRGPPADLPGASQRSTAPSEPMQEIGVQCRLVGAAGVGTEQAVALADAEQAEAGAYQYQPSKLKWRC